MLKDKSRIKPSIVIPFLLLALAFLVIPTHAQEDTKPQPGDIIIEIVDGKEVIHTISEERSDEDKNWPIISHEIITTKDVDTGKLITVETIIRGFKETDISSSSTKNCPEDVVEQMNSSSCSYYGPMSVDQIAYNGVGVRAYIKHYSNRYCDGIDCNYHKPYKVERSWHRDSLYHTVTNAWLEWGCTGSCLICGGGTTSYHYSSSPITVGWNSTHDSYVYTTTITWFSIMQGSDAAGSAVRATSHSSPVTVSAELP